MIGVVWLNYWRGIPVIHLIQPSIRRRDKDKLWQIYVGYAGQKRAGSQGVRWLGKLTRRYDFGCCVLLQFDIIEPFARRFSVIIYRDQLSCQADWQKLKTIARL